MLQPIVEFFEKLITDFSWRRLGLVVAVLVVLLLGLSVYESYTAQFRLGRLEREVALLERLTKLSGEGVVLRNETLRRAFDGLNSELEGLIRGPGGEYVLSSRVKKGLASALAWLALSLFVFLSPG